MAIVHMSFTAATADTSVRVDLEFDNDRATISGAQFGTFNMSIEQARVLFEALESGFEKPGR